MKSLVSVLAVCAMLLLGAQFADSQSVGGIPGRLRLVSLGVGNAPPAGTGNITVSGTVTGATLAGAYNAASLTGSVADARLSSNVALYNASMASFSSGTLADARLSGNVALYNGSMASFSSGTLPDARLSSNVRTISNAGRVAFGRVTGSTGAVGAGSLNLTVTRTGTGTYDVGYSGAGFTNAPACVLTETSAPGFGRCISPTTTGCSAIMQNSSIVTSDLDFNIACFGT